MSKDYVIILKESLVKKLAVLDEVIRIAKIQAEELKKEELDYEFFDSLVNDLDICMDELEKLDLGFEQTYAHVREDLENNKSEYKDSISEMKLLIKDITDRLAEIKTLDYRNKERLSNIILKDKMKYTEQKRSANIALNYYKNMNGLSANMHNQWDSKK